MKQGPALSKLALYCVRNTPPDVEADALRAHIDTLTHGQCQPHELDILSAMVAQRRQAAQAGASRRSAAAERTRLRHKWRRQLETIHRKAGDLMTEMLRELGDEHIATDRLDSILAEASLLLDALDRPTDNFWGLT